MNKFLLLLILTGLQELLAFWAKPIELHFHEEETFNLFENFNETEDNSYLYN